MSKMSEAIIRILVTKRKECNETLHNSTDEIIEGSYCPGIFDDWMCWPPTPANTTAWLNCPNFLPGFDSERLAHKECDETGNWFKHPRTNKSWSNYSNCVDLEHLSWTQMLTTGHEIGYSISLIALIISLAVLIYFRTIRCPRIIVHMNLFVSFAANSALWLLWYRLVIGDNHVMDRNETWCQILHVVLHYFLLTNYTWMLCEGLYLHTVLISAFISENKLLRWLYPLGWGIPAVAILIYVTVTLSDRTFDERCWVDNPYMIVLIVPGCLAMALNVIFLCNIVRVLLVKLRGGPHVQGANAPSRTALQAFRATLLLVPLLGLNYFLTPFRPPRKHPWEPVHDVISLVSATLQGFCVATLFCFCNGEVIAQVKRKWRTVVLSRPRANSCTATTVSQYIRSTATPLPGEEKV